MATLVTSTVSLTAIPTAAIPAVAAAAPAAAPPPIAPPSVSIAPAASPKPALPSKSPTSLFLSILLKLFLISPNKLPVDSPNLTFFFAWSCNSSIFALALSVASIMDSRSFSVCWSCWCIALPNSDFLASSLNFEYSAVKVE